MQMQPSKEEKGEVKREAKIEEEKDQKDQKSSQDNTTSSEFVTDALDMDDEFAELNLDDLDQKVTETIKKESLEQAMKTKDEPKNQGPLPPPPFPKLHYLNVSHNQVCLRLARHTGIVLLHTCFLKRYVMPDQSKYNN